MTQNNDMIFKEVQQIKLKRVKKLWRTAKTSTVFGASKSCNRTRLPFWTRQELCTRGKSSGRFPVTLWGQLRRRRYLYRWGWGEWSVSSHRRGSRVQEEEHPNPTKRTTHLAPCCASTYSASAQFLGSRKTCWVRSERSRQSSSCLLMTGPALLSVPFWAEGVEMSAREEENTL